MATEAEEAKWWYDNREELAQDFVEAPSQMLENWVCDKRVLDTFASHSEKPGQKIPPEMIAKLKTSRLATIGMYYRRQLAFALFDLAIHGPHPAGTARAADLKAKATAKIRGA